MEDAEFYAECHFLSANIASLDYYEASGRLRRVMRDERMQEYGKHFLNETEVRKFVAENAAKIKEENEFFKLLRKMAADEEHVLRILGNKRMGTYKVY